MPLLEDFGINPYELIKNTNSFSDNILPSKPALLSLTPGEPPQLDYEYEDASYLERIYNRMKDEFSKGWQLSKDLWNQSEGEDFVPGVFHKGLSALNVLDLPRRGLVYAPTSEGLIDPLLRRMGLEHPEDLSSGFEVGNELGELLSQKMGGFTTDKEPGLLNPESVLKQYLPIVGAQVAGNIFDIYTDPLSLITGKTGDTYGRVQKELGKPSVEPLHLLSEAGEARNPSLTRSFPNIQENLEEAAKAYTYKTEVLDRMDNLLKAREEVTKSVQDPVRRRDLVKWINNQALYLSNLSKEFSEQAGKGKTVTEARSGVVLPSENKSLLKDTEALNKDSVVKQPDIMDVRDIRSLDLMSTPSELEKFFDKLPSSVTLDSLISSSSNLRNQLERQRPGLKFLMPGSGRAQPIPILTDLTAGIAEGVGKTAKSAQELFHQALFKSPSTYDISLRNQPVTDQAVLDALYTLEPSLRGKEIRIGDVEGLLAHISQVPGGIRGYGQAKDFAQRLGKTESISALEPIYTFLGKIAEQDMAKGYAGRGNVTLTPKNVQQMLKAFSQEKARVGQEADIFHRPLSSLEADGVTFDHLKEINKRRVYQWLLRQMRSHRVDDEALVKYTGYKPEQIALIRERVESQPIETIDRFEAALDPAADLLTTYKTVDDLVNEQGKLLLQQRDAIRNSPDPIGKFNEIIRAQLQNTPFLNTFQTILTRVGNNLQFSPSPFMLLPEQDRLKGLVQHVNELQIAQAEHFDELNRFLEDTTSRELLDLLYINSGKISSGLREVMEVWHSARVDHPNLPEAIIDPKIIQAGIEQNLGPALSLRAKPQIAKLATLISQVGIEAQKEFTTLLAQLDQNFAVYKDKQRSFNESIIPIKEIDNATKAFLEPAYRSFLAQSSDLFGYASQMLFNPTKENVMRSYAGFTPAAAWLRFKEGWTNLARGVLRNYGMEPKLVEKNMEMLRAIDYWKERAPEEATQLIKKGIYEPLFEKYGIPFNYKKLDQLDNGFTLWFNSGDGKSRLLKGKRPLKEIGLELLNDAFDGNKAAVQEALQTLVKFNEEQTRVMRLNENQAGIPTRHLANYVPNMLKFEQGLFGIASNSLAARQKFDAALKLFKKADSNLNSAPVPSYVGGEFAHSHTRTFENLEDFADFLDFANGNVSGNPYNTISPSNLQPETSYINLFAQRLQNHYIALNTVGFLRELERDFPHLIRSVKGVDKDIDEVLEQLGLGQGTGLGPASGESLLPQIAEMETGPATVATSLVGGKQRWSLRGDFAKYLEGFIPYGNLNTPEGTAETIIKWISQLNYRIQGANTVYNAGGHVKNILALALLKRLELNRVTDNLKRYGPDVRNHPLYDIAARTGVFPYGGIDHNKNVREVMNIRMARPKTGPIESPVLYGNTGVPHELKAGRWTIFRLPNIGADRMLGFLTQLREPEYFRYLTWDFIDKHLRLALFEQSLQTGMSRIDAADTVRNALIDYQLSWMNNKTKTLVNTIFPFSAWWLGNLRIHLPNMLLEPRFYVIANHLMNLSNMYSTGQTMDQNPSAVGSAVGVPLQNGPELLYWELGLPWVAVQNKIFKKLYDIWVAPGAQTEPLDLLGRIGLTGSALVAYLNSRARSIPDELVKMFFTATNPEAGKYFPQYQNDENFKDYLLSFIDAGFWGITPSVGPIIQVATGEDHGTAHWRSLMGQFGNVKRLLPTGEVKDY